MQKGVTKHKPPVHKPIVVPGLVLPTLPLTLDLTLARRREWDARSDSGYAHWSGNVPQAVQSEFEAVLVQKARPSSAAWSAHVASLLDRLAPRGEYRVWFPAHAGIAGVRRLLARHGKAALLPITEYLSNYDRLKVFLKDAFELVEPIGSPRLALCMAEISQRRTSEQAGIYARIWLARHTRLAIQGLLPFAVGKSGKSRRIAEIALQLLALEGHKDAILDAAAEHGDLTLLAVNELLSCELPNHPIFNLVTARYDAASIIALQRTIHQRKVGQSGQRQAAHWLNLVAAHRGLTFEQLDASIPDLGLDGTGSLRLDFGPREFTAKLTPASTIEILDGAGKLLKTLPKPRLSDDAALATQAKQQLGALRKNLRSLVSLQKTRLEQAMCEEKVWRGSDFVKQVLSHPIVSQLARKLVWGHFGHDHMLAVAFHVGDCGRLLGLDGCPVDVPAKARVGVVHPLHLGSWLQEWRDLFALQGIEQPFRQILRTTYRAEDEKVGNHFGIHGATVTTKGLLWLDREDWNLSFEDTSQWYLAITRGYGTCYIQLNIDPPLYVVTSSSFGHDHLNPRGMKPGQHTITVAQFPELPPIPYSEAIRQLLMIRVE